MDSMILTDVNVLIAAFREDHSMHRVSREWLGQQVNSPAAYGISDRVLEGFIRIVTHPRAFANPDPLGDAIAFVEGLTSRTNCVHVNPGVRQWKLFLELATLTNAAGNSVADTWLAALAIESGSEWITWDKGFAKYPGLKWSTPTLAE